MIIRTIIAATAITASILVASSMDYEDAKRQESDYCAGVKEWAATGGKAGNPDYNMNANEVCK